MALPELSIILVNWNTCALTLACLRALYAETLTTDFEVYLVDNGSSDGSAAAIQAEFPQIKLLAEDRNHGFAVANNLAGLQARGQRLLLLNSDTLILNRAIDRLMEFANAHPSAKIWGGRTVFADGSLNIGSAWGAQTLWGVVCFAFGLTRLFRRRNFFNPEGLTAWQRDSQREVDIVSGCFLLIETALWRQLKGFDPTFFMYGEDADLCARAKRMGAKPMITPDATIIHYGGASGVQRSDASVAILRAKIALAQRNMPKLSAQLARGLLLISVVNRRFSYGFLALFRADLRAKANLWREVLRRRAEWSLGHCASHG